jgi:hypothetical protein
MLIMLNAAVIDGLPQEIARFGKALPVLVQVKRPEAAAS